MAEEGDQEKMYEENGQAVEMPAELSLAEQLNKAQAEAMEYKDQWIRARADLANARKRMEKERIELYGSALVDVVVKLLPVMDDFRRATASVPASISSDGWYNGIALVQRKLNNILESLNIEPLKVVGATFDPNWHEAILQEDSDSYPSGTITKELQTGYKFGDRIIRPALVAVAK